MISNITLVSFTVIVSSFLILSNPSFTCADPRLTSKLSRPEKQDTRQAKGEYEGAQQKKHVFQARLQRVVRRRNGLCKNALEAYNILSLSMGYLILSNSRFRGR